MLEKTGLKIFTFLVMTMLSYNYCTQKRLTIQTNLLVLHHSFPTISCMRREHSMQLDDLNFMHESKIDQSETLINWINIQNTMSTEF